jgi:hypothetical protein
MAAVLQYQSTTFNNTFTCGVNGVVCQSPTSCNPTPTNYLHSGCLYAQLNGFSSSGNQSVTIQAGVGVPPTAPGVNSSAYWVTVRVNQSVPQLFSAVLGNPNGLVSARATAALSPAQDCIYVMDPSGSGTLAMNGSPTLIASCGVYINSTSPTALTGDGTATLRASEIDIVGGSDFHGTLDPNPPNTGIAALSDPLASLPAPSVPAGCDHNNYSVSGFATVTLSPGVYCGGIDVRNATVTFNPGMYILKGSGLTTNTANSIISGTGVTIYNTYDPTSGNPAIRNYGPINIVANSSASLTAPTTGTYAGVLIMEDRTIPAGVYFDTFGGGSNAAYTGIIYGPKSNMTFYGNASLAAYTLIVSYRMSMVGTTDINNNYASLPTGNPIKVTALVE